MSEEGGGGGVFSEISDLLGQASLSSSHDPGAVNETCVSAGLTSLLIRGKPILLTEAIKWAESELMGSHAHNWPLTKLLDIGGVRRAPRLTGTHGRNSTPWPILNCRELVN